MWHGFATCDLRAHKGAHDKPTSPAFQATSPMRGGKRGLRDALWASPTNG